MDTAARRGLNIRIPKQSGEIRTRIGQKKAVNVAPATARPHSLQTAQSERTVFSFSGCCPASIVHLWIMSLHCRIQKDASQKPVWIPLFVSHSDSQH